MITVKKAKELLKDEGPVTYQGVTFEKISALIFRKQNGRIVTNAELLDQNKNSVIIVRIEQIEEKVG